MGKNKDFPVFLSPDMYCIVFSCVVHSRLTAFGRKWETKSHRKVSHSTVTIPTPSPDSTAIGASPLTPRAAERGLRILGIFHL